MILRIIGFKLIEPTVEYSNFIPTLNQNKGFIVELAIVYRCFSNSFDVTNTTIPIGGV
jgi:hypothetical protein